MVQTNQMISCLNTSVNVQKQDSGKTAKNDDSKSSFSEALGKEISAQEKPAGTENSKTEESQMQETAPETQLAETLQQVQVTATVIPWTMQPQMMQQADNAAVQPVKNVNADPVQMQIAAADETVLTENKPVEMSALTADTESMLKTDVKGADSVLFAEKINDVEAGQKQVQHVSQPETVENSSVKAEFELNTMKQTPQTETVQQQGQSEMISQNVQTQTAPQQTVETVQTSKPQTVDMSNMKQGLENLAKTMSEQITQGKQEFEIWLEPANLGKMAVKVAYEGGKAMLSIICMSEKTLEIVSQNAKSLGAILQQNTGTDTVVVVEERQTDYLQQQTQQQGNGQEAQKEKQNAKNNEQEAQQQSFLQQLRLGLMQ